MAIVLTNSAEGGTNGTAVTPANSGGTSGTAFTTVNIGTGCTFAYDSTFAYTGLLSYKIASSTTSATVDATWSGLTPVANLWIQLYLYLPTTSTSAVVPLNILGAAAALRCAVQVDATRLIRIVDSTGGGNVMSTNTVALDKWIRLEVHCLGSATAGQVQVKLFNNPASIVPTETVTTSAAWNTGAADLQMIDIGFPGNQTSIGPFWIDDFSVDNAAYIRQPGPMRTYSTQQAVNRSYTY